MSWAPRKTVGSRRGGGVGEILGAGDWGEGGVGAGAPAEPAGGLALQLLLARLADIGAGDEAKEVLAVDRGEAGIPGVGGPGGADARGEDQSDDPGRDAAGQCCRHDAPKSSRVQYAL